MTKCVVGWRSRGYHTSCDLCLIQSGGSNREQVHGPPADICGLNGYDYLYLICLSMLWLVLRCSDRLMERTRSSFWYLVTIFAYLATLPER